MPYLDGDICRNLMNDVRAHARVGDGLARPIVWSLGSLLADPAGSRAVYAWNSGGDLHALALEGARLVHMKCTSDGVPEARAFAVSRIAVVSVSSFEEGQPAGAGIEWYATQWTLKFDDGSTINVGCSGHHEADHLAEFMKSLLP